MAYPPQQQLTVRDGGVGLIATQAALPLVVGVSSLGTVATLYQFTDPQTLKDTLGFGPAVELALPIITAAGGVLVLKTASSTAGSNGAVTKTAIGTSTGTITLSGTPKDSYRALVQITGTGGLGVAKFKYALDRKVNDIEAYTFSEEITVPAGGTYVVPNTGVTLTFVIGGGPTFFESGDKHRFDSVAPHYTTADLGTAVTALLLALGTRDLKQVFWAGRNPSAAAAATIAAAVSTHMATLAANQYYARAMMDAGADTAANIKTSFAAIADARLEPVFGSADLVTLNGFAGWGIPSLPAMNVAAERAAGADLSENLGRKESGAVRGVRAITQDEGLTTQFSEADKITTLRTYRGQAGFYVTNGYLKSPVGSDFLYWDWGRVIDVICKTVFDAQDRWLLKKLRAVTDGTGNLDDRDAVRVESAVRTALKAMVLDPTNIEGFKGHVSGIQYTVDRTNDYLSTRTVRSTVAAVPLPPAETIVTTIGFARSVA